MAPDLLLVVLDTVRKDHLSCYGHKRPTTPNIDELAMAGTRYTTAIATAPWTPPSHASMFTGQFPSTHGVYGTRPELRPDCPSVAEELDQAGYDTFGFSNSFHTSKARGFDRGFRYYHDLLDLPQIGGHMLEPSREYLNFLLRHFLRGDDASYFQLEKLKSKIAETVRPFFGFINLNSAHAPYTPPARFERRFAAGERCKIDGEVVDLTRTEGGFGHSFTMGEREISEEEWEKIRRLYDAEIAYMDSLLGDLFDFLKREGRYEDTLVVVTSDHGEHFGENGLALHNFSLSEVLINVPLVVKWPDGGGEPVDQSLRSLVDLAPTILEEADVAVPGSMEGMSLRKGGGHDTVFAEYGYPTQSLRERMMRFGRVLEEYDKGLQAVRTSDHKLVRDTRGQRTLYEVGELTDHEIVDERFADELESVLDDRLRELPRPDATEEEVSGAVRQHLEELGYM